MTVSCLMLYIGRKLSQFKDLRPETTTPNCEWQTITANFILTLISLEYRVEECIERCDHSLFLKAKHRIRMFDKQSQGNALPLNDSNQRQRCRSSVFQKIGPISPATWYSLIQSHHGLVLVF